MRRSVLSAMAIIALTASVGMAQDVLFGALDETANPTHQDEMLRVSASPPSPEGGLAQPGFPLPQEGCGCGESPCTCGGWIGSAELVLLTTHHDSGGEADDQDAQLGYRLMFGRHNGRGQGLRVRYFDLNEDADFDSNTLDGLDVHALDFEWYSGCQICCGTDVTFSAGIRHLDIGEIYGPDNDDNYLADGWGPVIGLQVNQILCNSISAFALLRESVIELDGTDGGTRVDNMIGLVTEVQVGAQYDYHTCKGTWFVRGAMEGQSITDIGFHGGYVIGLIGGNVSVGLSR